MSFVHVPLHSARQSNPSLDFRSLRPRPTVREFMSMTVSAPGSWCVRVCILESRKPQKTKQNLPALLSRQAGHVTGNGGRTFILIRKKDLTILFHLSLRSARSLLPQNTSRVQGFDVDACVRKETGEAEGASKVQFLKKAAKKGISSVHEDDVGHRSSPRAMIL